MAQSKSVEKIIRDIKTIKIQGARNIAKAALIAIGLQAVSSKAKNINQLYAELKDVSERLVATRSTEPMVRNSIEDLSNFTLAQIRLNKISTVAGVKKLIIEHEEELIKKMDSDYKKLVEYGAKLLPENAVVMTHCHSSTVTGILKRAHAMKKNISVISCETRPLFQGRTTSKELVEAGLDVTMIVDGAMNLFMKKSDICLVGADAITSRGDLINKVGTSTLAHIARMHDVSFYAAAELFKYSPMTALGQREKIEERNPKEVWDKLPKGLKIANPAFDATAARYISGYITEIGIIPPQSLYPIATEKLGIKIYE
ncbi:MAG: S-methyl-5-thioribose-1-phosphate isomerase [Candidatus Micrarchaeota archaeon]|nr:S-methyl-5-thioribose-1-phosphate isomerase [Candidatus Micrarchaeota archaeon]